MAKHSFSVLCAVGAAALLTGVPAAAQQTQNPPPASQAAAPAVNPAVEEVVSLYNAKFSEDFIKRKIKADGLVYTLGVADLLRLKEAGIPESLVEAMLATKRPQAAAGEGQAPANAGLVPAAGAVPVVAPMVPGQPRPPKVWEGLVRNSSGAVLGIGHRWENGALQLENEQFKWVASEGADRNALVPASALTEQFLVCEKKPTGDCFEWGAKTKNGEYRFRDILWKTGATPKVKAIYDYMKAAYPNLPAPTYPVDERK